MKRRVKLGIEYIYTLEVSVQTRAYCLLGETDMETVVVGRVIVTVELSMVLTPMIVSFWLALLKKK